MREIKCNEKMEINGIVECAHQRLIISGLGGCICNEENCYKLRKVENKDNYLKRCGDCGRFVEKERWVDKDHPWKKRALCFDCESNYDDLNYCP